MSLQRTLKELKEYKVKHEKIYKEQEHFDSLHLSPKALAEQHMMFDQQRLKEGTFSEFTLRVSTFFFAF